MKNQREKYKVYFLVCKAFARVQLSNCSRSIDEPVARFLWKSFLITSVHLQLALYAPCSTTVPLLSSSTCFNISSVVIETEAFNLKFLRWGPIIKKSSVASLIRSSLTIFQLHNNFPF